MSRNGLALDAQHTPSVRAAASAILKATHLLVAAGAGFSADSGLPCYDAIASVKAYDEQGITYADLCTPSLLNSHPRLAYGFWGSCFNLYQETAPHEGYQTVKSWCSTKSSWHVYTSNVDGHFLRAGFAEDSVCEFHGRIDQWLPTDESTSQQEQQASKHCSLEQQAEGIPQHIPITTLSAQHRFTVEEETQLLPELGGEDVVHDLRSSGVPVDEASNHPLRPAVLMFDDNYQPLLSHLRFAQDRYQRWEASVEDDLERTPSARLVILEVEHAARDRTARPWSDWFAWWQLGCGSRVPAVRAETAWVLHDAIARAALCGGAAEGAAMEDARVLRIRINLDDPDDGEGDQLRQRTIHIQGRALSVLREIDAVMQEMSR